VDCAWTVRVARTMKRARRVFIDAFGPQSTIAPLLG
jgi:hypothetical protein